MNLTTPVRSFNEALGRIRSLSPEQFYQFHYGAPLCLSIPSRRDDAQPQGGITRERHPVPATAAGGGKVSHSDPTRTGVAPEGSRVGVPDLMEKKR